MVRRGDRAVVLFVVLRPDCDRFAVAADLDPEFARTFGRTRREGVEALVYGCAVDPGQIALTARLPTTE